MKYYSKYCHHFLSIFHNITPTCNILLDNKYTFSRIKTIECTIISIMSDLVNFTDLVGKNSFVIRLHLHTFIHLTYLPPYGLQEGHLAPRHRGMLHSQQCNTLTWKYIFTSCGITDTFYHLIQYETTSQCTTYMYYELQKIQRELLATLINGENSHHINVPLFGDPQINCHNKLTCSVHLALVCC